MRLIFLTLGLLSWMGYAHATPIINQTTGLDDPDLLITFGTGDFSGGFDDPACGNAEIACGDVVDTQFAGVTFGPTYWYAGVPEPLLTFDQGVLINVNQDLDDATPLPMDQPGAILFDADVDAAVFSWAGGIGETTFEAYLDGVLVESFAAVGNGQYFGFENSVFDEIRLSLLDTSNTGFILDNLQATTVPEPGTLGMMGAGLFALGFMRRKRAA